MVGAEGQLDGREQGVIVADRDGVIRGWGSRCAELLGYSAEEAIGHKVDLIIPSALRSRHWRGFRRAMKTAELKTRWREAQGSGCP
jgi:PAS domain S-box-containing protein